MRGAQGWRVVLHRALRGEGVGRVPIKICHACATVDVWWRSVGDAEASTSPFPVDANARLKGVGSLGEAHSNCFDMECLAAVAGMRQLRELWLEAAGRARRLAWPTAWAC